MLSWIFGTASFKYVFIGLIIVGCVFLVMKYDWAKIVACIAVGIGTIGLTVFCGYNINQYYSAKGGLFGVIGGVFKKPEVIVEKTLESTKFNFNNLVLKQEYFDNENHYATTIKSSETFILSSNDYIVFINETPLKTEIFNNSITAYFNNAFFGDSNNCKLEDTLKIDFYFYKEYTNIKISSEGGLKAYGYWLSYFEKEKFSLEIKEVKQVYEPVDEKCELTVVLDDKNIKKYEFNKGSELKLGTSSKNDYEFLGWSLIKGGSFIDTLIIDSDKTIYANWKYEYEEEVKDYKKQINNFLNLSEDEESLKNTDEMEFLSLLAEHYNISIEDKTKEELKKRIIISADAAININGNVYWQSNMLTEVGFLEALYTSFYSDEFYLGDDYLAYSNKLMEEFGSSPSDKVFYNFQFIYAILGMEFKITKSRLEISQDLCNAFGLSYGVNEKENMNKVFDLLKIS